MSVMVDSCVFLDIFTKDPTWFSWSSGALTAAADRGTIVMNPVIYAEISVRFKGIEELEDMLPSDVFEYRPIPREAAFLAGKNFLKYRRRGGQKSVPLPDFFIGAHAAVSDLDLVTRDAQRFRQYFPSVHLICP
jgi:predicted nucleic acid-binding protein